MIWSFQRDLMRSHFCILIESQADDAPAFRFADIFFNKKIGLALTLEGKRVCPVSSLRLDQLLLVRIGNQLFFNFLRKDHPCFLWTGFLFQRARRLFYSKGCDVQSVHGEAWLRRIGHRLEEILFTVKHQLPDRPDQRGRSTDVNSVAVTSRREPVGGEDRAANFFFLSARQLCEKRAGGERNSVEDFVKARRSRDVIPHPCAEAGGFVHRRIQERDQDVGLGL